MARKSRGSSGSVAGIGDTSSAIHIKPLPVRRQVAFQLDERVCHGLRCFAPQQRPQPSQLIPDIRLVSWVAEDDAGVVTARQKPVAAQLNEVSVVGVENPPLA